MKRAELLKPAELEMLDAMAYYERQAEGLGSNFIDRIDEATTQIEQNPEAFPVIRSDVRRCVVKQFPFALLCRILPDRLLVLATMHLRRHPTYWIDRS